MGRGVAVCSSRSATARSTAASATRDRLGQGTHGLREPLPLGRGGLEGDPRAAEQLAALGEPGFEGAQCGGRLGGVDLGEVQLLAAFGEGLLAAFDARRHLDEAILGAVALGDEFELAGCRSGAAAQHGLGHHVAVAGDDRHVGSVDDRPRGVQRVDDEHRREQPEHTVRRGDEVRRRGECPAGKPAGGDRGPARARHHDLDSSGRGRRAPGRGPRCPTSRSSASTASARVPSAAAIAAS